LKKGIEILDTRAPDNKRNKLSQKDKQGKDLTQANAMTSSRGLTASVATTGEIPATEDAGKCDDHFFEEMVALDPDKDIEERITNEIRKTIGGVLSQIVEQAISGSIKDTVDMDDVQDNTQDYRSGRIGN
jgi:hypothetical protein